MKLRWQNKRCTPESLQLMENAVKKVEERLQTTSEPSNSQVHVPTAINDELYQSCICVAVAPNACKCNLRSLHVPMLPAEGCCFRGMECTQYEVGGKVYNIAILPRRVVKGMSTAEKSEKQSQQHQSESSQQDQETSNDKQDSQVL